MYGVAAGCTVIVKLSVAASLAAVFASPSTAWYFMA